MYIYIQKMQRIFANCSVAAVILPCLAKILSNVYIYSIYIQRYIRKLQRRLSCLVLLKHLLYVNIYSRCSGIFANCSVAAVILPCVAKIFIKCIYIQYVDAAVYQQTAAAAVLPCSAKYLLYIILINCIYIQQMQRYIHKLQRRLSCLVRLKYLLYVNICIVDVAVYSRRFVGLARLK